jgi:NAD(P)-dependent dehydrogenase (short-subunit alcohol dehydrogenase family)
MATALLGNLMKNPEVAAAAQQIMSRAGITKPLETYEAANLVFFLSSPESSMITGEDVAIDGGFGVS